MRMKYSAGQIVGGLEQAEVGLPTTELMRKTGSKGGYNGNES
jgi:hypothetical protein